MEKYKYLIVGGGMSADAAVKGIREVDDKGGIAIIGNDQDPPYSRPPLSKKLWKKGTIDDIWLKTEAKGATIIPGHTVTSIDPDKLQVKDDQGNLYSCEKLLLATGGKPKKLPFGTGFIYYRTAADYRKLKELSEQKKSFAVLGGGFIGSEIAAALAMNGKEVTMVFPEAAICSKIFPAALAKSLNALYREKGVNIASSCKPSKCETTDKGGFIIHLEDGALLEADGVVAGIGVEPDTSLAEDAGLEVDNGIVVDENLKTGNANIFAAGDVACFYNPILDMRMRVEHEDNALTMGMTAGKNMAGRNLPYHHLPFFYSDLFDAGYEAVGETVSSYEVITKVKSPEDKGPVFYMKEGRVRGVVFWNLFGKVDAGRELIAAPGPHSAEDLERWTTDRLS